MSEALEGHRGSSQFIVGTSGQIERRPDRHTKSAEMRGLFGGHGTIKKLSEAPRFSRSKPTSEAWRDISMELGEPIAGNGASNGIIKNRASEGTEQAPLKHIRGGNLIWPPESEEEVAAHARDIDRMYGLPPAQLPPIGAESLDARRDRILSNGHNGKPLPTFGADTHWDQEQ